MNRTLSKKSIFLSGIITLCLVLFPLLFSEKEYFINLILLIGLYAILSHSWNIFGGYCGQISLGQGAFFGMGALVTRYIWTGGYPMVLALLGGAISSVILSGAVGIPTLKLKGHYFSIGTLALSMIGLITVTNALPGVDFLPPDLISGYSLITRYYMVLIVGGFTLITVHLIARSKLGLGMLSIREDEEAAEAIGINTFKYKVFSLAISTFIAGLAGGLFAVYSVSFYRYVPFELVWSFDPMLITYIGGNGTLLGPLIGSLCYVILKEIFAISLGQVNVLIFGVVFILIVLFLPKGIVDLFGRVRPKV